MVMALLSVNAQGLSTLTASKGTLHPFAECKYVQDNVLLPEEVDAALDDDAILHQATTIKQNQKDRERYYNKHNMDKKPRADIKLAGTCVFIASDELANQVAQALRVNGQTRCDERCDADIFLLQDVSAPGQRTAWCLALGGGVAVDTVYIESGGTAGVAVNYKRSLRQKRKCWLSGGFRDTHPVLTNIVETMIAKPGGKWILLDDERFLTSVARHSDRNMLVALVTAAEKAAPALAPSLNNV